MSDKPKKKTGRRVWILYDGRACGGFGTDEASVLVVCDSNKEAESYKGTYGAMACYAYEEYEGAKLMDETWLWDWH